MSFNKVKINRKTEFFTVKFEEFKIPRDDIFLSLKKNLPPIKEGDLIFITTKILAIHQGRCIKADEEKKDDIIKSEADYFIDRDLNSEHSPLITIINNTLILSAGLDESNGNGHYILWPENIDDLLTEIRDFLINEYSIKSLGLIATDSKTVPLRKGIVGSAISCVGFEPIKKYAGKEDIFHRVMKVSEVNIAESLAAFAVMLMGEGNEMTPVAICRNFPDIEFSAAKTTSKLVVKPEEDIFYPILDKIVKK